MSFLYGADGRRLPTHVYRISMHPLCLFFLLHRSWAQRWLLSKMHGLQRFPKNKKWNWWQSYIKIHLKKSTKVTKDKMFETQRRYNFILQTWLNIYLWGLHLGSHVSFYTFQNWDSLAFIKFIRTISLSFVEINWHTLRVCCDSYKFDEK